MGRAGTLALGAEERAERRSASCPFPRRVQRDERSRWNVSLLNCHSRSLSLLVVAAFLANTNSPPGSQCRLCLRGSLEELQRPPVHSSLGERELQLHVTPLTPGWTPPAVTRQHLLPGCAGRPACWCSGSLLCASPHPQGTFMSLPPNHTNIDCFHDTYSGPRTQSRDR